MKNDRISSYVSAIKDVTLETIKLCQNILKEMIDEICEEHKGEKEVVLEFDEDKIVLIYIGFTDEVKVGLLDSVVINVEDKVLTYVIKCGKTYITDSDFTCLCWNSQLVLLDTLNSKCFVEL